LGFVLLDLGSPLRFLALPTSRPPRRILFLGFPGISRSLRLLLFRKTLAESFDRGVTARLRMRFECTIMRAVETDEEDSDDRSDILEMHPQSKVDGDGVVRGGERGGGE
jgi:hypothetical protein